MAAIRLCALSPPSSGGLYIRVGKANPPAKGGPKTGPESFVFPENETLPGQTVQNTRAAQDHLDDDEFEEVLANPDI